MPRRNPPQTRWAPASVKPSNSHWYGAVLLDDGRLIAHAAWQPHRGWYREVFQDAGTSGGFHNVPGTQSKEPLPNVEMWLLIGADTAVESFEAVYEARIAALSTALADALATFKPDKEIIVTTERQEAWRCVLLANGSIPPT